MVKSLYHLERSFAMATETRDEIRIGQLAIRFLLEGKHTDGAAAVFEFDVPAGAAVPAGHSHDAYDETIYVLEGVLTWTIEGRAVDVAPGEVIHIQRGEVHRFDNAHETDAKALAFVTPAILSPNYFREVAAVIDAAAGGPPDLEAIETAMRRHGLTPAV
jgi:quercetin dioxygenase-like cupin family protein